MLFATICKNVITTWWGEPCTTSLVKSWDPIQHLRMTLSENIEELVSEIGWES
jgi:hypothetical protein